MVEDRIQIASSFCNADTHPNDRTASHDWTELVFYRDSFNCWCQPAPQDREWECISITLFPLHVLEHDLRPKGVGLIIIVINTAFIEPYSPLL